jgi:hypothetical protein
MHENLPLPPIFTPRQRSLDPAPRALKLAEQVLVLDIIDLDAEVLVHLPVGDVAEVEPQHRDHVRDARIGERALAPQREDAAGSSARGHDEGEGRRRKRNSPAHEQLVVPGHP